MGKENNIMGTEETVQTPEVPLALVSEEQTIGTEATAQAAIPVPTLTAGDVKRIVAEETEKVKRLFQSEKDRTIAQIRRESEQALTTAQQRAETLAQKLAETDPEAAASLQLADKEAQLSYYQRKEAAEAQARAQAEFDAAFKGNLAGSLAALGVDPTDKGIDWAEDTTDYLQRQQRILGSAGKIHQSRREAERVEWKSEIAKIRRDLGWDSVDTSVSTGVRGKRTYTKKEIDNMSFLSPEYQAIKVDLDLAEVEGRIKE